MARPKKQQTTKRCGACKWYEPNCRAPGVSAFVGLRYRCKYEGKGSPQCESDVGYADVKARQWVTADDGSECSVFKAKGADN